MNCLHPITTESSCAYSINGIAYYGTTPKYKLEIDAGISMADFDFQVKLQGSNQIPLVIQKSSMFTEEGNWFFTFNTEDLGIGKVKAVVTATITDSDFPNGVRKEVWVINNMLDIKEV